MASQTPDKPAEKGHRYRRRLPCVNHRRTAAAARCEVCRKPICKECIQHYEGALICSSRCWDMKMAEEAEAVVAENRTRRRK